MAVVVGACHDARVPHWSVDQVAQAIRESWSADTCDPADLAFWSKENPSKGQCGPSALVVHDILGGDLIFAEVLWPDGSRQGFHYWNLLPDGSEIDLTVDQFTDHESVQPGCPVARPPGPPGRCQEQYAVLRERVLAKLLGRPQPTNSL